MTNEQIRKEIAACEAVIEEKQVRVRELKRMFSGGKWSVGDIYEASNVRYVVISAPYDEDGRQATYRMKVAKVKKDGTPSQNSQYPYSLDKAVKVGTMELGEDYE